MREVARSRNLLSGFVTTLKRLFESVVGTLFCLLLYRWPSWIVYDQAFQQEMAGEKGQLWAKVDPSTYSVCFFGQNMNTENWCSTCRLLDYTSATCPEKVPRMRGWSRTALGSLQRPSQEICQKYNKFNGDCRYGGDC